jgi:hypothetical protein
MTIVRNVRTLPKLLSVRPLPNRPESLTKFGQSGEIRATGPDASFTYRSARMNCRRLRRGAAAVLRRGTAAPVRGGSWDYTDYTADPASFAAAAALHVATGATITSYCDGGRVPAAPQDVNAHSFRLTAKSAVTVTMTSTGVWGLDVKTQSGAHLAGTTTSQPSTTPTKLVVTLRPGRYTIAACNLGGAPTAHVSYQANPVRK